MSDPTSKLSWDDLRVVQAVARTGALAAAAQTLGINVTTITRRLAKVEEVLGVALFDRRRAGYVATAQGGEVVALAERVELDVIGVARRVSGHAHGHAGELRITTSDSLLLYFLTPMIASFKACNPAVRVEVTVGNGALNLARGEADIAIRATEKPPENLFGRKVSMIAWAPYRAWSDKVADSHAGPDRQWVSYGGRLSGLKAADFVAARVPPDAIGYRTDSVAGAAAAIAAGMGVGYLPCMLGDLSPDLQRIGPIEPALSDDLWLLTHPDIRRSGRVYAFMTHCSEAIAHSRELVEGRLGATSVHGAAPDHLWRSVRFPGVSR
ncbi:LysR family transcriptional regulator [Caulobacter segnis]|uniref:Transcriptional regulator, LysR family n=2 Tax=Caulobacter segnis TaxID=88688 RepID=D5VJ98_CAUST|nr:LysR family transcriptional regulator [Caulobacter segnis]ADG10186.1 transcriptional regulator, LysR family [Caulobacter segnis ATCC 21756]AVQ01932.1 LysR family transcriptional regulator [Caulobacter segnis]